MVESYDYKEIDDLLCSRIRLAIISVLVGVESTDFKFLKSQVKATDGNLSVHLKKLEDSDYLKSTKGFVGRKPNTTYEITKRGRDAFKSYVTRLESMLKGGV